MAVPYHEVTRSDTQLNSLVSGLKFWTGLTDLAFDPSGTLTLGGGCRTSGGSATARKLFLAAAASQDSFIIENSDNCPTIAFAQIQPIELYVDAANARHNVWKLRIDFADFDSLRGDHQALAAFDPAIGVLHELAHGVLNYFDPIDANDQIGECETFINQVRAELGLPLRQTTTRGAGWPQDRRGRLRCFKASSPSSTRMRILKE